MKVYLIRHGETIANQSGHFCGWTETVLSENGIKRLEDKRNSGLYPNVDHIYLSPLLRCQQTTDIIYPNVSHRTVIETLKEVNFGDFEGKTHQELNGNELYQEWLDDYMNFTFPNGESLPDFAKRVVGGLNEVKQDMIKNNFTTSAVVCHSGVIRAIAASISSESSIVNIKVDNGEGYLIDLDDNTVKLFGEKNE
jgi:alpha-ribazole phosphatase